MDDRVKRSTDTGHGAQAMQALIEAKKRTDPAGWQQFQSRAASVKLQLSRAEQQLETAQAAANAAVAAERLQGEWWIVCTAHARAAALHLVG